MHLDIQPFRQAGELWVERCAVPKIDGGGRSIDRYIAHQETRADRDARTRQQRAIQLDLIVRDCAALLNHGGQKLTRSREAALHAHVQPVDQGRGRWDERSGRVDHDRNAVDLEAPAWNRGIGAQGFDHAAAKLFRSGREADAGRETIANANRVRDDARQDGCGGWLPRGFRGKHRHDLPVSQLIVAGEKLGRSTEPDAQGP